MHYIHLKQTCQVQNKKIKKTNMLLENTENETLSDTFTGLTDHTFINLNTKNPEH